MKERIRNEKKSKQALVNSLPVDSVSIPPYTLLPCVSVFTYLEGIYVWLLTHYTGLKKKSMVRASGDDSHRPEIQHSLNA